MNVAGAFALQDTATANRAAVLKEASGDSRYRFILIEASSIEYWTTAFVFLDGDDFFSELMASDRVMQAYVGEFPLPIP